MLLTLPPLSQTVTLSRTASLEHNVFYGRPQAIYCLSLSGIISGCWSTRCM